MKQICQFIRNLMLAIVLVSSAAWAGGLDQSSRMGFRYGPNLSWDIWGNTPFVWGQWLPQFVGELHYSWLEPLDELNYGDSLGRTPTFLKMEASIEASPFYSGYMAGLGIRPFATNPQFEIDFVYESFLYLKSNLEMVTSDVVGEGRIAETWNADYVTDNVWRDESADWDYAQLFDFGLSIEYAFQAGAILGASLHYILSDISTDFDGKSYDYKRNMPVFSRDFLLEIMTYGRIPFSKHWALLLETAYYRTGYLRKGHTVEKESLGYGLMMLGPHLSWHNGLRNLTLEVGAWKRYKDRFYDGSLSQQFLVQLEYQGYFSFPIHRTFAE